MFRFALAAVLTASPNILNAKNIWDDVDSNPPICGSADDRDNNHFTKEQYTAECFKENGDYAESCARVCGDPKPEIKFPTPKDKQKPGVPAPANGERA